MKKAISIFIVFFLLIMSVPKANAADDITGHFFENDMRFLIEKGILKGDGTGIYRPDADVTRAEFAAFMVRALNNEPVTSAEFSVAATEPLFNDVNPQDWYYSEIDAAVKMGLVAGYPDKSFKPNNVISRQDMAVITYEAIKSKGILSNPVSLDFKDKNAIQDYALDAIQHLVSLGILHGNDDNTFAPLANTTRGQTAIVIKGMLNLKKPPVVDESYKVVEFNQDGTTKELRSFADFNTAKSKVANNQAVMQGNSIVYIKSGMAVSNSFTIIYNDANFVGSGRTYVSTGTEFQYLDAGTDWVKISIANKEGYVKPANVNLIPNQLIADQSSYKNVKGELYYTIYNPIAKTSASILVGKAPSFMVEGQKYYSWDGGVFYNNAGQEVGQAYQYFNYLPARTISNYTAEELNNYIDTRLEELQSLHQSNPILYARYQGCYRAK